MMSDTILEYKPVEDSFIELGTMAEARSAHSVSVVKYSDFFPSHWCNI